MLTDPVSLHLLVRERIQSRLNEAANDRLADSFAVSTHVPNRVRHAAATLLRGLAAGIDPCVRAESGLLIATR